MLFLVSAPSPPVHRQRLVVLAFVPFAFSAAGGRVGLLRAPGRYVCLFRPTLEKGKKAGEVCLSTGPCTQKAWAHPLPSIWGHPGPRGPYLPTPGGATNSNGPFGSPQEAPSPREARSGLRGLCESHILSLLPEWVPRCFFLSFFLCFFLDFSFVAVWFVRPRNPQSWPFAIPQQREPCGGSMRGRPPLSDQMRLLQFRAPGHEGAHNNNCPPLTQSGLATGHAWPPYPLCSPVM